MEVREFLLHARLDMGALDAWIEAGWLVPVRDGEQPGFSDMDLARVHLIHDLKHLGVNDEGIPVVLDLVDQVHGLRRALRELLTRCHAQPETTRRLIAAGLSVEEAGPSGSATHPTPPHGHGGNELS